MSKAPALPVRRLPQRTCVGCGTVSTKGDLTRVVRTPAAGVLADPTGKMGGRGAYVCSQPECWDKAVAKGKLERSLKTKLSAEDAAALRSFASGLAGQKETV